MRHHPSVPGFCHHHRRHQRLRDCPAFATALLILFLSACLPGIARAENGYRLWLRYDRIDDPQLLQQYRSTITSLHCYITGATLKAACEELTNGLSGLLGQPVEEIP